MAAVTERWCIDVENGFRLTDGHGRLVHIGQRKCEELLYAIASKSEERICRDALAEEIWPLDSLSTRRTNFRQALKKLKRAIGEDRIFADRQVCTLANGFEVSIAGSDPKRLDFLGEKTATAGLLSLMEWQASDRPELFFETMRSNAEMVKTLPATSVERLVRTAAAGLSSSDLNRHWAICWTGLSHFSSSGISAAAPHLKLALEKGLSANDEPLVFLSGSTLAIALILGAKAQAAIRLLDRIEARRRSIDPTALRELSYVRAAALQHLGRANESSYLLQVHGARLSTLAAAANESLKGFFHATDGRFRLAADTIEAPLGMAERVGAPTIRCLCELTLGYIDVHEAPPRGVDRLSRLAVECDRLGFAHLALYAREGVAVAHWNSGQFSEAKMCLGKELRARRMMGFQMTQWDRSRLAPIIGNRA